MTRERKNPGTLQLRFNKKDTGCVSQDGLVLAVAMDLVMPKVVGELEGRETLIPLSGAGDPGVAEEVFF